MKGWQRSASRHDFMHISAAGKHDISNTFSTTSVLSHAKTGVPFQIHMIDLEIERIFQQWKAILSNSVMIVSG